MQDSERRGVDEAYASAMSSTNLRVESACKGDADLLIAAGWSHSRVGAALIRLHSEWDGAARGRVLGAADFERRAKAGQAAEERSRAQGEAMAVNEQEARLLFAKLKTLPAVQEQLSLQLARWQVPDATNAAGVMARWWLQRRCGACSGTGLVQRAGKVCKHCSQGEKRPPMGELGKRAANYMDDCVQRARASIGKALRNSIQRS